MKWFELVHLLANFDLLLLFLIFLSDFFLLSLHQLQLLYIEFLKTFQIKEIKIVEERVIDIR
jgi:hypothetical protein